MQISSNFVGTRLRTYQTRITWRDTMNYAAATGDDNPVYFDDERADGIVAPPMFAVAATWPIIENLPQYLETSDFPREILLTQVHYSEHIRFHRPIRPEDELTIKGHIAAILPHRAGTHIVTRFDAFDRNEKPVFSEHTGAMMRGVACSGGGKGEANLPGTPERVEGGRPQWQSRIKIDPLLPFVYDGCTHIVFPIHTSKKFARKVGLPGIILQGTATLALAARELIKREAAANPLRLKEIYGRFSGMVLPGSDIHLKVYKNDSGAAVGQIFFDVINAEGKKAIRGGYALVADID